MCEIPNMVKHPNWTIGSFDSKDQKRNLPATRTYFWTVEVRRCMCGGKLLGRIVGGTRWVEGDYYDSKGKVVNAISGK